MKIGLVFDNYKLEKFKAELKKRGFTDFKVVPSVTPCTKAITVITTEDRQNDIKVMCHEIELWFKSRN